MKLNTVKSEALGLAYVMYTMVNLGSLAFFKIIWTTCIVRKEALRSPRSKSSECTIVFQGPLLCVVPHWPFSSAISRTGTIQATLKGPISNPSKIRNIT
jgi:hypothetical protein